MASAMHFSNSPETLAPGSKFSFPQMPHTGSSQVLMLSLVHDCALSKPHDHFKTAFHLELARLIASFLESLIPTGRNNVSVISLPSAAPPIMTRYIAP